MVADYPSKVSLIAIIINSLQDCEYIYKYVIREIDCNRPIPNNFQETNDLFNLKRVTQIVANFKINLKESGVTSG